MDFRKIDRGYGIGVSARAWRKTRSKGSLSNPFRKELNEKRFMKWPKVSLSLHIFLVQYWFEWLIVCTNIEMGESV